MQIRETEGSLNIECEWLALTLTLTLPLPLTLTLSLTLTLTLIGGSLPREWRHTHVHVLYLSNIYPNPGSLPRECEWLSYHWLLKTP